MPMIQRRQRRRSGMALVECALVMSICLLFIFGILEYARYVMTKQLLDNAAREGARYAVVHTHDATTTQVQDLVDGYLAGQGTQLQGYAKYTTIQVFKANPSTGASTGPWTDAQFGDVIAVQISGSYKPVLPVFLFMADPMPIQGMCIMKSEAN
jgi:Flp pilus assembly protein TadG